MVIIYGIVISMLAAGQAAAQDFSPLPEEALSSYTPAAVAPAETPSRLDDYQPTEPADILRVVQGQLGEASRMGNTEHSGDLLDAWRKAVRAHGAKDKRTHEAAAEYLASQTEEMERAIEICQEATRSLAGIDPQAAAKEEQRVIAMQRAAEAEHRKMETQQDFDWLACQANPADKELCAKPRLRINGLQREVNAMLERRLVHAGSQPISTGMLQSTATLLQIRAELRIMELKDMARWIELSGIADIGEGGEIMALPGMPDMTGQETIDSWSSDEDTYADEDRTVRFREYTE